MTDLPDGTYTAVVDSVEDGLATVFFERDGDEVAAEMIDADRLPASARHGDAVLSVTVESGDAVDWTYHPDETDARQSAAQDRFDRLASRQPADESDDG